MTKNLHILPIFLSDWILQFSNDEQQVTLHPVTVRLQTTKIQITDKINNL